MRYPSLILLMTFALSLLMLGSVAAEDDNDNQKTSLLEALGTGNYSLGLRYRFESVDQDAFADHGLASTLRTTLTYQSGTWHGVSALVELEDVHNVGFERSHNNAGAGSLSNRVSDRPVIADPELTEINQVYLSLTKPWGLRLRVGRQEVNLSNQRHVGAVGWRQHHQSFEAVRIDLTTIADTTLCYTYLDRVHRINGGSKPMSSHLFEVEHVLGAAGTLRAYSYLLDYQEESDSSLSTSTYGASFTGIAELRRGMTLLYRAELAEQRDAGDNRFEVAAGYRRLDLGLGLGMVTIKAGWELLEGGSEGRFMTPLATLHAFNGWADLFLATPYAGLDDRYLSAELKHGAAKLVLTWHDFSAVSSSDDYGSELDLLLLYTLPWQQKLGLKAAIYDADYYRSDVTKIMVWTSWKL